MIINKIQEFIKQQDLFSFQDKLIVGVSGGIDSVVLIRLLKKLGYSCIVAHCNFHLRGEESDRDADFTESLAKELNFPFRKTDFETKKQAAENKLSVEMAARELRYNWFEELKNTENADCIAVAHHSDDIVETFLINLVRGTGLHGLTGIKPRSGDIVRPLLPLSRKEIIEYQKENNLFYVEDSTNKENIYVRNRFRNRIIPELEILNPSFRKTLLQTITHLQDTEKFVDNQLNTLRENIFQKENEEFHIPIESLKKNPSASFILYELLQPYGFNAAVVRKIQEGTDSVSGKKYYSEKYRIIKDRENLILSPIENTEDIEFKINGNEREIISPIKISVSIEQNTPDFVIKKDQNICYLNADKLTFPLTIRKWRQGDRFIPFGMNKSKKLSDYFVDRHFSLTEKEKARLLISGDEIVWIIGERSDDRFKITETTKKIMILEVKK